MRLKFYSLLMQFFLSLFDSSTATKWDACIFPRFPMQLSSRQAGDVRVAHVYEYILGYSMGYITFLPSCWFSLNCIFLKGSSQLFLLGLKFLSLLLPSHWLEHHRHRLVCAKSQRCMANGSLPCPLQHNVGQSTQHSRRRQKWSTNY